MMATANKPEFNLSHLYQKMDFIERELKVKNNGQMPHVPKPLHE